MTPKHILRIFAPLLITFFSIKSTEAISVENNLEGIDFGGIVEIYIPTTGSKNEQCRNHSKYYLQELRMFSLWATEMFDATSKFPTGFLYGSSYDFGNFDECLRIKVPYGGDKFSGKYCMAKFTLNATDMDGTTFNNKGINFKYETVPYESYSNITIWKKINDYLNDASKSPRNKIHFAFCLPSSCSGQNLEESLKNRVVELNRRLNITFQVEVDERSCQVQETVSLDGPDIAFICVVMIAIVNVVLASSYDFITRRDDYSHYKMSGQLHNVILCFSVKRNFKKLTTVGYNVDGLNCTAGMKVYSMILAISLHRNMFDFGAAVLNIEKIEEYYSRFELTFMLNGPILVDTFFTITGFLATYLTLKYYFNNNDKINIVYLYIHRYIRMTPTYAVILAFYCTLFVKLGNGPLWQERIGTEQLKCREVWWANILFINNYYDTKNYCMFQSWYMACDMNAFLVVPVICLILYKKPSAGLTVLSALIVASIITVFVTVYYYDELPILLLYIKILLSPTTDSTFLRIYIPGHMRVLSYLVGVLAGYTKYRMDLDNYKISKVWVRFGWIATVVLLVSSLHIGFIFYIMKVPTWFSALYGSMHYFCWSLGISWMLVAISSGYGHWLNPVLSWAPLVILSRLTYTVFLCHGAIQLFSSGIMREPIYASTFNTVHSTAADVILAYSLALALTLLFEAPLIRLEKIILWKDHQKNVSEENHQMDSSVELSTVNPNESKNVTR